MSPVYLASFQTGLDYVVAKDPSLKPIVDAHEFPAFFVDGQAKRSSFSHLVRSILGQQVSGAAGKAILQKFLNLVQDTDVSDPQFPSPERVREFSVDQLRTAGLSMRKAEYVRDLAQAYLDNQLSDQILNEADDDEVVDRIVAVRGLGPWTAQMFLIFYLQRSDVYSPADIGVQRGFRRYISSRKHLLRDEDLAASLVPTVPGKSKKALTRPNVPADLKDMEKVAARFAPYRTAFQMIMWKISDIQMGHIEGSEDPPASSDTKSKRRKVSKSSNC